jgi:tRNA1(Val) A37 N6-methylase TrmN6
MTRPEAAADVTDDAALGGRLRLLQPRRGHRFGHDAVLLAAATAAAPGARIIDLGAGVGLAGLALAARVPGFTITLVERDPELVRLAGENIRRNALVERAGAVALDVAAPPAAFTATGLPPGCADGVLMNPPFNDPARQRASTDTARADAHMVGVDGLETWCGTARRLLAPGGRLTLIWRADGLLEVLNALAEGFGGTAVLPVHPRPDQPAIRILVAAEKGGRAPLRLLPGLDLNDLQGRPTALAEAVMRDAAALTL